MNHETQNKNHSDELTGTLNKIIYDMNLLMEKVKNLEEFKKFADKEIFEFRADNVDLKADDVEIKKTVAALSKESKILEHETRKLSEHANRLDEKTKLL